MGAGRFSGQAGDKSEVVPKIGPGVASVAGFPHCPHLVHTTEIRSCPTRVAENSPSFSFVIRAL